MLLFLEFEQMKKIFFGLLMLFCFGSSVVLAESFRSASLEDQWGETQVLDDRDSWFILATDKTRGEWVKESLLELQLVDLEKHKLVYVADVSSIPSFVLRFVGLPILKKLPFKVLLDREGDVTETWPRKEAHVSIFLSQKGEIKEKHFFADKAAVQAFLQGLIAAQ